MLKSVSTFITLFRHALIALDEDSTLPSTRREVMERLETKMTVDVTAFSQLLDVREKKISYSSLDAKDVFRRYLATIEHVTNKVDEILAGKGRGGIR